MSFIKHFGRNTKGRDLAIGDIHGHFDKAMAALLAVGFDPACDRVFSVGDMIDRGPQSHLVLDWLQQPWFHAVRGNHEQMCVDRIETYLHMVNGGSWFVGMTLDEQRPYVDAMAQLPVAIEVETESGLVGIVHADPVAPDWGRLRRLLAQPHGHDGFVQACMWSRDRVNSAFDADVSGIRAVVVGHTPMERMKTLGNVVYIDTGAWLPEDRFPGKQFTVLDLATLTRAEAPSRLFGVEKDEARTLMAERTGL